MEDQTTEGGLVMMNGIIKTREELGKVSDLQVQILQASEGKEKLDDGDERRPLPRLAEIIAANLEVTEGDGRAGPCQELQKAQVVGTVPQGQGLQSAERRLLGAGKQRTGERNA